MLPALLPPHAASKDAAETKSFYKNPFASATHPERGRSPQGEAVD